MARKYELGVRYFSHDTDMAWDKGVRKLSRRFGAIGYGIFNRLLECIYKDGYYKEVTEEFIFEIIDSLNMDEEEELKVRELISFSVEIGLFSKDMYEQYNILTSHGMQVRYFQAKEQSIRHALTNDDVTEYQHLLIDIDVIIEKIRNGRKRKPVQPEVVEEEIKPTPQPKPKVVHSDEEERFNTYMQTNFPRISKMSKPLTLEDYKKLRHDYGGDILEKTMANIENFKELNKKYVSAKQTLSNWCKNESNGKPSHPANITGLASDLQRISQIRRANEEQGNNVFGALPDEGTPF